MRIAHIASHRGNIGDIINHEGFYKSLLKTSPADEINKIEIRDFYFNSKERKTFDTEFAEQLNEYDLVVLGGGGFFDLQWNNSSTGTTLNFSKGFVDTLKTNVIVNAMGYHEYPGKTNNNLCKRFESFLLSIIHKRNWLISVRNDGSYQRIKKRYGKEITNGIIEVPDNGFFCPFPYKIKQLSSNGCSIGFCITNDLFTSEFNKEVTGPDFNAYMARIIDAICDAGNNVMLLPHIPSDIGIISSIMSNVSNESKRNHISIGSLDCNGIDTINRTASNYLMCDVIIGMRFHSLITGLDCRIPTIALAGHEQISGLFSKIGLVDYCVKLDNLCFKDHLISLINYCLVNSDLIKHKYDVLFKNLEVQKEHYSNSIYSFINHLS